MTEQVDTQGPTSAISRLWLKMGGLCETLERARTPEEYGAVQRLARERIHEVAALQGVDALTQGRILQILEVVESVPSPELLKLLAGATCQCHSLHPGMAAAMARAVGEAP